MLYAYKHGPDSIPVNTGSELVANISQERKSDASLFSLYDTELLRCESNKQPAVRSPYSCRHNYITSGRLSSAERYPIVGPRARIVHCKPHIPLLLYDCNIEGRFLASCAPSFSLLSHVQIEISNEVNIQRPWTSTHLLCKTMSCISSWVGCAEMLR